MRMSTLVWGGALVLALVAPSWAVAEDKPAITRHRTPSGVRFVLLGAKGKSPAPTLFVFASAAEETLRSADFNKVGRLLGRQGYLCVSLDIPCHGQDETAMENGLGGWRVRLEKGDPLVPGFVA